MSFSWRYESLDGSGVAAAGLPQERFPTQADAESWIGETWRELLAPVATTDPGETAKSSPEIRP